MSQHTKDTVIGNKDETIRRLIEERDAWKSEAEDWKQACDELATDKAVLLMKLSQKGGA